MAKQRSQTQAAPQPEPAQAGGVNMLVYAAGIIWDGKPLERGDAYTVDDAETADKHERLRIGQRDQGQTIAPIQRAALPDQEGQTITTPEEAPGTPDTTTNA